MRNIAQHLEAEMAKAASIILAASHAAAINALDEAFGMAKQGAEAGRRHRPPAAPRRSMTPRRSSGEIADLERRLLDAVWETPGEVMSVLAPRVDATVRALQVPVARLRAAGRLKTVGTRQFTRYYPIERSEEAQTNDDVAA